MRLTGKMLDAMAGALAAALAGGGFEAGDFAGENPEDYERAASWVAHEQQKRADRSIVRQDAATESG